MTRFAPASLRRAAAKAALLLALAAPLGLAGQAGPANAAELTLRFDLGQGAVRVHDNHAPRGYRARDHRRQYGQRVLPPRAIARRLGRQGFHDFRAITYRPDRGVYRVRARDQYGMPVMARVDARSGQLRAVRYLEGRRGGYRDYGGGRDRRATRARAW